ncbi:hypothetical protein BYT27DRAFT_7183985 [Phlegmacium glaucopus]|nr:hypothetical protein BYT27DRAFT_7183985 [Phlegmacium glaucopus]
MSTLANVTPPPFPLAKVMTMLLAFNASIVVEVLFYGIQFVLFCVCMYILLLNRHSTHWFIPLSAFVMFALSTADIAISIRLIAHDFFPLLGPDGFPFYVHAIYPKAPIFVANNFIAELILLYRCYIIWGRSKYLLCGASLLVLGDSIWGLLILLTSHSEFVPVYKWSLFAINIVLTAITVARIFWVSRLARPLIGSQNLWRYRIIMAILIETSAIYSACLLASLLFPSSPYSLVMGSICVRMVTIMPTLLIVQLGLGWIRRESNTTMHNHTHRSSVVLDSFAMSVCINAEEGAAVPAVSSRSVIHEDQHGVITSDRADTSLRP